MGEATDPWEGFTGQSEADAEDALIMDPLVVEIGRLRAALGDSETKRVELEAALAKVDEFCDIALRVKVTGSSPAEAAMAALAATIKREALAPVPSVVLQDCDRAIEDRVILRIDQELQQKTVYAKPYANWKGEMSKKQRWYGKGYVNGLASAFGHFRGITDAITAERQADQDGEQS